MWLGFVAALVPFAVRWIAAGSPVPDSPANLPVLGLMTMTAVGLAISPAPELGVNTAGQVVASLTLFYLLLDRLQSEADLWRGASILVILGILFAIVAPFTVQWTPDKLFDIPFIYDRAWPRLDKVTNSNILAGALALVIPIALALVEQEDRRWYVLGGFALAPLLFMLILLQSRGAFFGLAAGLAIWATLHRPWVFPLIPVVLTAGFVFNNWSGGPPLTQWVYGRMGSSTAGTLIERQDMWIQSVYLVRQSPFAGIGLGAYPRVAPYAWPYSAAAPGMVQNHAHNLFLQVALDAGVLGLAAFAVLLFLAVREAWIAYRLGLAKPLAIGVLGAFVVLVVHGLGDVVVWGTAKPSIILWMLLALGLGLGQIWSERLGQL
jgi:putative inorganic carbon (HCO3(-)) transporter